MVGIVCQVGTWSGDGEEGVRYTWLNGPAHDVDVHSHDVGSLREEQLRSITTPARVVSTIGRNLPLAGAFRKRFDVNLSAAGFTGGISEPFSICRNLGVHLLILRLEDGYRLSIARQRNRPDIAACFGIVDPIHEEFSVRRKAH